MRDGIKAKETTHETKVLILYHNERDWGFARQPEKRPSLRAVTLHDGDKLISFGEGSRVDAPYDTPAVLRMKV